MLYKVTIRTSDNITSNAHRQINGGREKHNHTLTGFNGVCHQNQSSFSPGEVSKRLPLPGLLTTAEGPLLCADYLQSSGEHSLSVDYHESPHCRKETHERNPKKSMAQCTHAAATEKTTEQCGRETWRLAVLLSTLRAYSQET